MKIHRPGIVLGVAVLLGVTGCAGGDTTAADSTSPAAASTSPADSGSPAADSMSPAAPSSATIGSDEGCVVVEKTGSTENEALQSLVDSLYVSIDCSGSMKLGEQLQALAGAAEFKAQVADQGWTADVTEVDGAVVVSVTDLETLSLCKITVLDSPAKGKSMVCLDA